MKSILFPLPKRLRSISRLSAWLFIWLCGVLVTTLFGMGLRSQAAAFLVPISRAPVSKAPDAQVPASWAQATQETTSHGTILQATASDPLLLERNVCRIGWPNNDSYVVQNIAIVDLTNRNARVRRGGVVWVEDRRIKEVGFGNELSVPDTVQRVNGCGQFLMAGLSDMHVHILDADIPSYLDHGITTVRNLWGYPGLQETQARILRGDIQGPTIYAISPGLDDLPEYWPYTQLVRSPEEAIRVVQQQVDDGWTTLKLYADLRRDVYDAIVREAQKHGLEYGGHVSKHVGIQHALESKQRFVEHLSGYEMSLNPSGHVGAYAWKNIRKDQIPLLVQQTLEAGTWNSPTLAIYSIISRGDREVRANRQQFVKALFDAGAPLLAGTDSGIGQTVPGASLLDELMELEEAGIPRQDVLRITTLEAARFLHQENEFGSIRSGLRADFILLDANPLASLDALRNPTAVFTRGQRVR